MLVCLRRDNALLNIPQEPLPLGQAQTKIADLAEVAGPVDLHHIDAVAPPRGAHLNQTYDPAHVPLPPHKLRGRIIHHSSDPPIPPA